MLISGTILGVTRWILMMVNRRGISRTSFRTVITRWGSPRRLCRSPPNLPLISTMIATRHRCRWLSKSHALVCFFFFTVVWILTCDAPMKDVTFFRWKIRRRIITFLHIFIFFLFVIFFFTSNWKFSFDQYFFFQSWGGFHEQKLVYEGRNIFDWSSLMQCK